MLLPFQKPVYLRGLKRWCISFDNNGTSWTEVNSGLTNQSVNALAVSETNLFAGTEGGGVFLSTTMVQTGPRQA